MPIEAPPDVDTTFPPMDITGPGVAGDVLTATGAHAAHWAAGGGGGGEPTGKYFFEGGGLPQEKARAVAKLTLVTFTCEATGEHTLKIETTHATVLDTFGAFGGQFSISFFVAPGESWKFVTEIGNNYVTEFEVT